MLDIDNWSEAQLTLVRNAYSIVDALASRDHMANFWMTVQDSESTRIFHEMLECAVQDGIDPAYFLAIHALGQCAAQLDDYEPCEHFSSLSRFLFDTVQSDLGSDICASVHEWTDVMDMDDAALTQAGTWAKISAMMKSLFYVTLYADMSADFLTENRDDVVEETLHSRAAAAACKDLGPALSSYFEENLAKLDQRLQTLPPSAPPPPAPL